MGVYLIFSFCILFEGLFATLPLVETWSNTFYFVFVAFVRRELQFTR